MKFPTTPPPRRKHRTDIQSAALIAEYPLTKSKSHESQLAGNKNDNGEVNTKYVNLYFIWNY